MKTLFIVNPRSGRASRALPSVTAFAAEHGASVALTERSRHACDLARAALDRGMELVVAVGGDGTMNEVASELIGTCATLGLVPCGSGDGLGRHLGIHGSIPRALEILRSGRPRLIDTGLANGHPFFTVAGVGFEAEIAERFNALHRRGFARYLSTAARALQSWQPRDYLVTHDGATERFRAFTLAVANANQYGNNARIAPGARLDDGLLNLAIVPPVNIANAAPLVYRLFTGTLSSVDGVALHAARHIVVETDAPANLHTDGEGRPAASRIAFSVRPASLRVMCPAAWRPANSTG